MKFRRDRVDLMPFHLSDLSSDHGNGPKAQSNFCWKFDENRRKDLRVCRMRDREQARANLEVLTHDRQEFVFLQIELPGDIAGVSLYCSQYDRRCGALKSESG